MTSENARVLITGATGYVGFRILLEIIQAGFAVKAVVRSQAKAEKILQNPKLREAQGSGRLACPVIPDFTEDGIWDEELQDVEFIIHAASPLPLPNLDAEEDIFHPTLRASDILLKAALKAPRLKRIVLTSSILATMPLPPRGPGPYNAEGHIPTPSPPFSNVYNAYQAAKIHLLNSSRELVEHHRPEFDIVNVIPGYIFGKNEMATTVQEMFTSSNALLLMLLKGRIFAGLRTACAAHIDDVAKVHLKVLDLSVPGNMNYGVSIDIKFDDAIAIAKKHFPEAFEKEIFSVVGNQPSDRVVWDASATEKVLDMNFIGYEQMVIDVVSQFLALSES